MRKKLISIISILGLALFMGTAVMVPVQVGAVDVISPVCENENATERPSFCEDNASAKNAPNPIFGPGSVLSKVINILSVVVGIISVFVIIISAVKLITSMGDPTGVATARGGIIYACIAILIVALAQVMVRFILGKL